MRLFKISSKLGSCEENKRLRYHFWNGNGDSTSDRGEGARRAHYEGASSAQTLDRSPNGE